MSSDRSGSHSPSQLSVQNRPRTAQERPKSAQERPKSGPRAPKRPQERFKRPESAPGAILVRFWSLPGPQKSCSRLDGSTIFTKSALRTRWAEQSSQKGFPEAQTSPKSGPRGAKTGLRRARAASRAARSGPRRPQEPPDEPQERPRDGPGATQTAHAGAQRGSRQPHEASRGLQRRPDAPGSDFEAILGRLWGETAPRQTRKRPCPTNSRISTATDKRSIEKY